MDYLQQGGSPDAIGRFLAWLVEGQVALKGYVAGGRWFDIGDRRSYLHANQSFMIGKNSLDPTSEVLGDAIVGSSVGRRSHVRNSVIKNSILLDDVQVSDCAITNSVVDNHSKLTGVTLHDSAVGQYTALNGTFYPVNKGN